MEIIVRQTEEAAIYGSLEISMTGHDGFSVHDGEPEDNNLSQNFSDCWGIPEMLELAFLAGKRGESLRITYITVNEDDEQVDYDEIFIE